MIRILIRNTNLRIAALPALIVVIGSLVAACGGRAGDEINGPKIVATTSVWGDVVSQIVGDDATVEVLIPAGADAHDYEATSRQVAALQEADLVIANGLGLEEGLDDILDSAAADGANVVELAPELDPIEFADHGREEHEDEEHEDEEHADEEHEHGPLDPHVWFDPSRVDTAATLIANLLADIDDTVDWSARAMSYSEELDRVDEEIAQTLAGIPAANRKLVTNHDAFGYFADRYGFDIIAVVIPGGSTLGDPSSAGMAALVDEIEEEGVRTIFAETTNPTRLADAVAAEVGGGVSVVELYTGSLGEPGSEADTLTGMLLTNANRIHDALSG